MNGAVLAATPGKPKLLRARRCENCGHIGPNQGHGQLPTCREDSPQAQMLITMEPAVVPGKREPEMVPVIHGVVGFWPTVRPEEFCNKWKPIIET